MILRRVCAGVAVSLAWFFGLCFMPGWALFGVLVLMAAVCQREFYAMLRRGGFSVSDKTGIALGVVWLTVCFAHPPQLGGALPLGHQLDCLLLTVLVFAVLMRVLFDARIERPVEHVGATLLGFFYLPFMLSFFVRLAQWGADGAFQIPASRVGVFLAAYVALVVKLGDVGAFAVGMAIGRHKMFPRVSPKKSWEGLAGGLTASTLASIAAISLAKACACVSAGPLERVGLGQGVLLGIVLGAVGVLGDLVESMFKRAVKTKDSAGLLPGMGGILDMFDSLIFAPAVLYFYLAWFVGHTVTG